MSPSASETLLDRGIAQQRAGQHEAAIAIFLEVAKRGGTTAALLCRLGESYEQLRDFQRANDCYVAAIERDPRHSEPYFRAADLAQRASALAARAGLAATADELRSSAFQFLNSLGVRLTQHSAWLEAEQAFLKARAISPEAWTVHVDLGRCFYQTMRPQAAVDSIREGIRMAPGEARAHHHLGIALLRQGQASAAEDALRQAAALDPSFFPAKEALGDALIVQGRAEDADALYCEVARDYESPRGFYLMGPIYGGASPALILDRHRAWGEGEVAATRPDATASAPFANSGEPGRRLRVGFVSPDFKTHSVAYFVEPLLACYDRESIESFCYAEVGAPDATSARLQSLAAHWRSTTAMDDGAFRRQVRADQIDILIDLAGHTIGNRLAAFAVKPAPVTASWLGYPTTTGLATIDWRITDGIADPPGAEAHHVERLMRLDGALLCFRPPDDAPDVVPLPASRTQRITFGSFNNLLKVTPEVVAVWAEILHAVPESRLLLKSLVLRDAAAQRRIQESFAAAGIAPERLDLRGGTNDIASHLAMYGEVDIALDTFPYNGTATTCEALWMGVPVVTLAGDRHSARVGASLLARAGLPDLVHADRQAYVGGAVRVAGDRAGLAARRAALRGRIAASPLCDGPGFARSFEAVLRRMWIAWCTAAGA